MIRRTEHGIPHIEASSWAGLGYGYGYAFAQDDICTMAEDYVTVDAQRSRFFGPSATYLQGGNGVTVDNLDSDFFFQQIIDSHVIDHLLALLAAARTRVLGQGGGTRLRRGLQPLPRRRRRHQRRVGSGLPRQAVGAADHARPTPTAASTS